MNDAMTTAEGATGSRRAARRAALQALYQWQVATTDVGDLMLQFRRGGHLRGADADYFRTLVEGTVTAAPDLEAVYGEYLDRHPAQLDPVERAILLLGAYELAERVEVPYRVVINEALELAKAFGATEGHRYVNGVLHRCAGHWRAAEVDAKGE
ncbi:NusB antitermination factor [Salinisphaera sp. PC39]